MSSVAAVAAAFVALAGSAAQAAGLTANDRTFLRTAAISNRAEIMTSQLALKRSSDPKVQRVANMLVREHTQALNDLKMLARLKQYSLPQGTDAKHMAVYRKLSRLRGNEFNRQYMLAQTRDHNAAVALFRAQMEKANDTNVRSYATKYYAPIFNHTEMIQDVAQAYKIPVAVREEGYNATKSAASASKPAIAGGLKTGGMKH
jgi:putative membrane protein